MTAIKLVEDVVVEETAAQRGRRGLQALALEVDAAFPERRDIVDALVTALVARQHVLLLGPPGVAKSAVARAVCAGISGRYFELLLTQFTDPGEVFGPFSMKGLQADEYRRITDDRLADADVAFLDEVFKANSAILNTLLTLINERVFHNGGKRGAVPLKMLVSASNEVPDEGSELDAFHDRLLVRKMVRRIDDDGAFADVMWNPRPVIHTRVDMADVEALHLESRTITATESAKQAIADIRRDAHAKGIKISDRRWVQAASLLQARAALAGATTVSTASLMPLVDVMWSKSDQIPVCREIVEARCASWMRQVQGIRRSLDEQGAVVARLGNQALSNTDRLSQAGGVLDVLDVLAKDIAALAADPDAASEATTLGALEQKHRSDTLKNMRAR